MTGPRWLDYRGRVSPLTPCARCGTPGPIDRYAIDMLRMLDWPLFRVTSWVSWCGRQAEAVPVPTRDGTEAWMVPVVGEAKN